MEVNFANTFADSLKRLAWEQTRIYKFYSFFRYDAPRFIKNIWRFRKALYNHYWFDHHGILMFMHAGLSEMADKIEKHGMEIEESRLKKVDKMRRLCQLIENYNESSYIDMAEAELGKMIYHEWEFEDIPEKPGYMKMIDKETEEEKIHNRRVLDRAYEIENQEWDEFCEIIKGQDLSLFKEDVDWQTQFDGSGLKYWWD